MEPIKESLKKVLARDEASGLRFELLEVPAGTQPSKHQHTDFEWVYVLEGQLEDEFGEYPAGTFKHNVPNSIHTSGSVNGCRLLIVTRAEHKSVV